MKYILRAIIALNLFLIPAIADGQARRVDLGSTRAIDTNYSTAVLKAGSYVIFDTVTDTPVFMPAAKSRMVGATVFSVAQNHLYTFTGEKWEQSSGNAGGGAADSSVFATRSWTSANFASLTGSYSNPSWINSLAWAKVTGAPTNVSSFTNDAGYLTSSSSLNATNLLSGTIPAARYGAGTIDVSKINASGGASGKVLSYDGTWVDQTGGGGSTDTASLSTRIDARVKYSDTVNKVATQSWAVPIAPLATTYLRPSNNAIWKFDLTNTVNLRTQATRQLKLFQKNTGDTELTHLDITGLLDCGMLSVVSRRDVGSDYPQFYSFSVPEHGRANGVVMRGVNGGTGYIKWQEIYKGSYVAAQDWQSTAHETWCMADEVMSTAGYPPVADRIVVGAYNRSNPTRFLSAGINVFSDYRTVVHEITDHVNDNGYSGFAPGKKYLYVRASGDIHFGGTQYLSNTTTSSNVTLSLDKEVVIYTGAGGTITLPDPTTADAIGAANAYTITGKETQGRTHIIKNMGTGDLTSNYPLWLDNTTYTYTITYAFPGNQPRVMSDGTKWLIIQ